MNKKLIALSILLASTAVANAAAASGKIVKTLPHFLDLEGRHMLRPSLYERDSYQAELKQHPERCSGMRFDIQWKARRVEHPKLRLEVKAANLAPRKIETLEQDLKAPGLFSKWSGIPVAGETFKRIGPIQAWRVTL